MDEVDETAGSFRWVLIPSCLAFLVLAGQQCYVVMTHTPRMLQVLGGIGADLSDATLFAAKWYWAGCAVAVGLTFVAIAVVLFKLKTASHAALKMWYFGAIAGVIGALLWSAFVTSAMYDPIFSMAAPI